MPLTLELAPGKNTQKHARELKPAQHKFTAAANQRHPNLPTTNLKLLIVNRLLMPVKVPHIPAFLQTAGKLVVSALIVYGVATSPVKCHAQAEPTAERKIMLSFFAGGTASLTGIQGVKNYGMTLGVDARLKQYFGVRPAIEVRGFLPFDSNALVSHKDVLAGVRIEKAFGRVLPYGDALFGRSSIRYTPYLPDPQGVYGYTKTSSNVYSPGGGVEYSLSPRFALKGDVQYQRYSTPVTVSGHAYATTVTVGVTYHLFGGEAPR